jgi:hypothetical protein
LEVKSSTQASKQDSTRPPKAWMRSVNTEERSSRSAAQIVFQPASRLPPYRKGPTYAHKLLDLALLDALLKGALLGGCEGIHFDVGRVVVIIVEMAVDGVACWILGVSVCRPGSYEVVMKFWH